MDSKPAPPPAAVLLRLMRKAAGLSVSEAARLTSARLPKGISIARWSQVENGYEIRAGGRVHPVEAEAGMLAHMAHTVGATPERLETEGQRPDAAQILREIGRQESAAAPPLYAVASDLGLPLPTEAMEQDLAAQVEEVTMRAEFARRRHPGATLTGSMVFPASPQDAHNWDGLTAAGEPEAAVIAGTAAVRAWRAQKARARENRAASG